MMIRYSELEAREKEMRRMSDPSQEIEGPGDGIERDEAEAKREEDGIATDSRDSVDRRSRPERLNERPPGP